MGTSSVDPPALWFAAQRLDDAAELLARLSGGLSGASVVSAALDQLLGDIALWQRAAQETAGALRAAARQYTEGEVRAVEMLR